jgi:putative tryptophan/tyrosine transport system substrate-binding protein
VARRHQSGWLAQVSFRRKSRCDLLVMSITAPGPTRTLALFTIRRGLNSIISSADPRKMVSLQIARSLFGEHMRRRAFITLLSVAASAWPFALRAQSSVLPVVALINARSADSSAALAAEFSKGLRQMGFAEGKDVVVEYHWLDGHYDLLSTLINDAIRRGVTVIATPGNTPGALAAKAATATIPIVFGVGEDPVALGLVKSLAHPRSNATGINFFASEINTKRLGLMHELLPKAVRFAVLVNPANPPTTEATSKALIKIAPSLGLELLFFNASTPAEIDMAFVAVAGARVDALFVAPDAFFVGRGAQFAALAKRDRLPASTFSSEAAADGLLMSYGTNLGDMFRQAGVYSGTILKGAKPAELPVLQSTKFEFIINLKTARLLGLDVPPTLLARADDVIE